MANPFSEKAKSSNAAKFKSITGKSGGGQKFDGSKQGSPAIAAKIKGGGEMKVPGAKGKSKLSKFARGGGVKKGAATVNIAIINSGHKEPDGDEKLAPMPMPVPAGPPPGGPPPGMPPMGPMARGGRLPTAGAETGKGRLQKAKLYK